MSRVTVRTPNPFWRTSTALSPSARAAFSALRSGVTGSYCAPSRWLAEDDGRVGRRGRQEEY